MQTWMNNAISNHRMQGVLIHRKSKLPRGSYKEDFFFQTTEIEIKPL
jgi:hypothetical protein